jgi:hypothetical protein
MGDMADFLIGQFDIPYWEDNYGDGTDYDNAPPRRTKTCKYCGVTNLYCMTYKYKWRLGDAYHN